MRIKNYAAMSDSELIALAQSGDKKALGELYERYVDRIYNYIYQRVGGDREVAEDLTSVVFLQMVRKIKDYNDKGLPFSAWLYRIAHNLLANHWRDTSKRRFANVDDLPPLLAKDASPSPLPLGRSKREVRMAKEGAWDPERVRTKRRTVKTPGTQESGNWGNSGEVGNRC